MLFCSAFAAELGGNGGSKSPGNGVVTLPLVDKQDIQFSRISVAGESLQGAVESIAQDRIGFLWFATDDGLYRYDGYSLKPYRHEPGNPNSLSDDNVLVVYRDSIGFLWVGTGFGGLDRFDPASDNFKHYSHDPGNRGSLSSNRVQCIYQDRGGALWVGTRGGLDRLDPARGTLVHYVHNPQDSGSLSSSLVRRIFEDHLGNLWAGTEGGGLNRLDRSTGRFSRFQDPNTPRRPGDDSSDLALSFIREDHAGVLWVGGALGILDPKTGSLTRYGFRSKESAGENAENVRALLEDSDGVLWLGTQHGLLALDRDRNQFVRYIRNPADPHSLYNDDILSLFEDAEGNIWVGTQSGVSRFNRKPRFINPQEPGNTQNLVDNTIRAVQVDRQGVLWVGTNLGLQRLDLKTGRFTLYQHDPHDPRSLSNNHVSAIREDRSGRLWVGTGGGGLDRFDRTTGRFFAYRYEPANPAGLSSDAITSLLEDRDGMLWVGTGAGLDHFDPQTGRFTAYRHDAQNPHSLPADDSIKTVFEDRAGILWVGTSEGLHRFDRASQQFTAYRHNPQDPASLSHNKVNAIWEDYQGTLWVATQDGLDQMDRSRGTFTTFTRKDGLPDNVVEAILDDDHGSLWLATDNGLSQFRPSTRTFRNYSESDGLPSNALSPVGAGGSCRARDGEMWFGSKNDLTSFYPDRISANPYVPPVELTDLLLFNKPVRPGRNSPLHKPLWATDSLTLSHTQDIFTLEFAALSYTAPESNRYRYRLEGLETEWNEVDSRQRLATYTNLSARKYVFQVQGSNNDGVWNPKITTLAITVLPPWWATWWFITIAGLTIAALVVAAYRSRIRGLQLAGIRLETQVAERTRELEIAKDAAVRANQAKSAFLATMSHELRTPLNSILGFSARVRDDPGLSEEHRQDLDIVRRSGENLLGLIDDVLDMAKIEAGHVTPVPVSFDLNDLVSDNVSLMRARASDKGLELLLDVSTAVPRFVRADAAKFRQVLVNLIGNALKYTERGKVTVRLDAKPMDDSRSIQLILEVEDTGIGIALEDQARIFDVFVQAGKASAQKGAGLGLSISRQFVHVMGGTIRVRSAAGKGSLFSVELPVERAEESQMMAVKNGQGSVACLAPGQSEYRILIVEDKRENWLLLQRLLLDSGFQVRVAEDGAQGVEMFRTWQPHLIWMDLRLPVMGGVEAAREIRLLDGGRKVKIVALTASVFAHQREEVLAAGLDDFVRKPYRAEEIFDCMARHLGVRYLYREAPRPSQTDPLPALRPEALAKLPEQLRKDLTDALVRLDAGPIGEVIHRVSVQDAHLGEALARLAKRFAYTQILNALEDCDVRPRHENP